MLDLSFRPSPSHSEFFHFVYIFLKAISSKIWSLDVMDTMDWDAMLCWYRYNRNQEAKLNKRINPGPVVGISPSVIAVKTPLAVPPI